MMATSAMTWKAPRWAKMSSALKDAACLLGIKIEMEVERGIFSERGRATISGDMGAIQTFKESVEKSVEEYRS